jgi:hypothetical protein
LLDGFEQEKERGEFLVGIHVIFHILWRKIDWGRRDDPTLQCTGRVTKHGRECAQTKLDRAGILMVLFDGNLT